MPKISVIIPVYNVENKISRCLDSLIRQTFTDYELILVNDGSRDLSGNICDEYAKKDKRIKVVHQKNSGVSVARNKGIANARGEYITFVDSDDYVEEEYLQVLYRGIQTNCELAICGIYYCTEGSDDKFLQKCYKDFDVALEKHNTECVADLLVNRRFNYVYGKMYRNDIVIKYDIRFRDEIALGEDTIFVMDYLRHVNMCKIIGDAYYNYVKYDEGTLTSKFYDNLFERYLLINREIEALFIEKGMLDTYLVDAIDLRILYASIWSVSAIRKRKICLKKRIEMLKEILHTTELVNALARNTELEEEYPEIKIMRKKSALLLLIYYAKTEVVGRKMKIIIVKIVPKKWIRRVKQWVSNVQLLFRRIMRKKL